MGISPVDLHPHGLPCKAATEHPKPETSLRCPCCSAVLGVAVLQGHDDDRPVDLRTAAQMTGEPISRMRRLIKEGTLAAVIGPRRSYMVRPSAVKAIVDALPPVVVAPLAENDSDDVDELARLRGAS